MTLFLLRNISIQELLILRMCISLVLLQKEWHLESFVTELTLVGTFAFYPVRFQMWLQSFWFANFLAYRTDGSCLLNLDSMLVPLVSNEDILREELDPRTHVAGVLEILQREVRHTQLLGVILADNLLVSD